MMAEMERSSVNALDDWLSGQLSDLAAKGLRRDRAVTRSLPDGWCERDGQRLLNFASNDYLDLCHNQCVRDAFASVANQAAGSGASALVSGRTQWHEQLEAKIADFEGTESAIVFPSGYAANVGTLSALAGAGDTVFCDRLNHASLVDGCRLSGATFKLYRYGELDRLRERVSKLNSSGRTFIVTNGVFSMDGAIGPLPDICDIADEFGAMVVVDEAHGTGVLGANGRGACEVCGVEDRVAVRIGTLSKAVGVFGGFVAGSEKLVDYLWNTARSQFFSTSLPPAVCAAAVAAFDVMVAEPQRRTRTQNNAAYLRSLLPGQIVAPQNDAANGVPIVSVVIGSESDALDVAGRVKADGFMVACIRPPTVPKETARLRISLSTAHAKGDIRRLAVSVQNAIEATRGMES
jgi:8-amino-7-oxononanoate synthase